jgi:hypothetical protein
MLSQFAQEFHVTLTHLHTIAPTTSKLENTFSVAFKQKDYEKKKSKTNPISY